MAGKLAKWILAFIFIAIAIAPFASADNMMGEHCEEAFLFEPGSQVMCEQETKFNTWTNLFIDGNEFIMDGVKDSTTGYRDVSIENPELRDIKQGILVIANALTILVMTYAGYMWIASSTNPKKRTKAKAQLVNAIYMLIFLNAGFFIANLGHELGTNMASYLETNTEEFFEETPWLDIKNANPGNDVEATYSRFSSLAVASPVLMLSGWLYTTFMYLRNIVVLLIVALAPLVVVLFFFEPTKPYGAILAVLYGIELFLPVLLFPLFKISTLLFSGSEPKLNILIMASTLLIAVALHLIVVGVAMIKSSGSIWISGEED